MKLRSNIDNGCGKTSRTKDLFESLVRRCLVLARRDTRQRERVHNGGHKIASEFHVAKISLKIIDILD